MNFKKFTEKNAAFLAKRPSRVLEQDEQNKEVEFYIESLKAEVTSLKDDWRMCDEACDKKQLQIQKLNVTVAELSKTISVLTESNLKLTNQIVVIESKFDNAAESLNELYSLGGTN
jgi:chromosome segregation ATPase